jgi:hypothetical protein
VILTSLCHNCPRLVFWLGGQIWDGLRQYSSWWIIVIWISQMSVIVQVRLASYVMSYRCNLKKCWMYQWVTVIWPKSARLLWVAYDALSESKRLRSSRVKLVKTLTCKLSFICNRDSKSQKAPQMKWFTIGAIQTRSRQQPHQQIVENMR